MAGRPYLPKEMLDKIFSLLENDRQTLGAVRLGSRALKKYASPYFITCAVFADRLPALVFLVQLLEDPYFQHTVTDILIDGSMYDRQWRHRTLHDAYYSDWASEKPKFAELSPRPSSELDANSTRICDAKLLPQLSILDRYALDWQRESRPPLQELIGHVEAAVTERTKEELAQDAWSHRNPDRFRGTDEYYLRAKLFEDRKLQDICFHLLRHSIRSFPRLRSLAFGDFRGLAQPGESYLALVERLFGSSQEPSIFPIFGIFNPKVFEAFERASKPGDMWQQYAWIPAIDDDIYNAETSKATNLKIQSISTCQPTHHEASGSSPPSNLWNHPVCIGATFFHIFSHWGGLDFNWWKNLFAGLTEIDIDFLIWQPREDAREARLGLSNIIKLASPTLRRVALRHGTQAKLKHTIERATSFIFIFEDLIFPHLDHLELAGWKIKTPDMLAFLNTHQSTLRQILLRRNYMQGDVRDLKMYAGSRSRTDVFQVEANIIVEEGLTDMESSDEEQDSQHDRRLAVFDWRGRVHKIGG